jgi:hypothetical protein
MFLDGSPIIADGSRASERRVFVAVVALALLFGSVAAWHYGAIGLRLSHYDARAHLVVARRVFDSLTPGWRQLGGVWLPLPHLLDLPLVMTGWGYRTGIPATALSVVAIAVGLGSLARWTLRHTESVGAAIAAPAIILGNPNVLYLQSTPMTEPLLLGLSFLSLLLLDDWIRQPGRRETTRASVALAALLLTRYEGWFVGAAFVAVAVAARWRDGLAPVARLLRWPALGVMAFFGLSWASTGRLLVTSGFYVADNPSKHDPIAALTDIVRVTSDMAGPLVMVLAAIGVTVCALRARRSLRSLLPLALVATAVLPFGAFDAGHPLRVRYMVPLVAAAGALAAIGLAAVPLRRFRAGLLLAAAAILGAWILRHPFDTHAPMVIEAQREVPVQVARAPVTAYLAREYDGTPILASMDSLAHYMQETSAIGLPLASFLHEGNGDLWLDAIASPQRHVHWILIQSRTDGRDAVGDLIARRPDFLAGFDEVAAGGDVVLYRRR